MSAESIAEIIAPGHVYTASVDSLKQLLPPSVYEDLQGTPSILQAHSGNYAFLSEKREQDLFRQCSTKRNQ